jgi:ABC-type polysaccharide/polyol phosphate export permease
MLKTLLDNKYLVRELVARDIRSRYVGSIIGVFWSILNPLLQLVLYTTIFSLVLKEKLGHDSSPGSFAAFLFCALLPWMAVQEGVTRSSRTFIENGVLIKKVRFPLEVLPFSVVLSALFHQFLGTLVFMTILIVNQSLNVNFFALVFILFVFECFMVYGLSLAVACLNVFFRDIAQILGVVFMLLFWITPMVYSKSRAPGAFLWVLNLNPLTHMVEAFRFVFLGGDLPSMPGLIYWLVSCVGVYYLGAFILRRTRNELVDLV